MQIDTAERHLELRKSVQPRFFGTPIKGAAPILHELPEVTDIGTVGPRVPWALVRETGGGEPVAEIGRCLVANSQRERFRSRGHASLVSLLIPRTQRERGLNSPLPAREPSPARRPASLRRRTIRAV